MSSFIAFCENTNCGAIFDVPSFMKGSGKISFQGVDVKSSCPICRSDASIPNGTYEYANDALIQFTGSGTSVEMLRQVQKILKEAHPSNLSRQTILDKVKTVSPKAAETFEKAPDNSNFHQWLVTITAIVTLAISVHATYIKDDDFEKEFRKYLLQENKELIKIAPKAKPFKREKPKIERNSLCPCGSGKKYKKCCILVV